eukprot:TRINITY_DN37226_c0_g1_i1.p1 TRINITY_DN37226_c0_g1~~TRINITY_DN37226_c0_g1_i1.p1  ORF type:complete len:323 (-),score=49.73 TRINITY_DN37226_c0_g1_i1:139-1107(-)
MSWRCLMQMLGGLWATFAVVCVAASETPLSLVWRSCGERYRRDFETLRHLSGAETQPTPEHHRTDLLQQLLEVYRSRFDSFHRGLVGGDVGQTRTVIERQLSIVRTQLLGCSIAGGRYWEVDIKLADYTSSFQANLSSVFRRFLLHLEVILCDPLGRAEKHFLNTKCIDSRRKTLDMDCTPNAAEMLAWPGFLKSLAIGRDLLWMMEIFGPRLLLIHQDTLRDAPDIVYSRLASFFGATETFPSNMVFGRYNSRRGHRTNLCHNLSLVRKLTKALEEEYQWQERALEVSGEPVPSALRMRQSRCERPEELARAVVCDTESPC